MLRHVVVDNAPLFAAEVLDNRQHDLLALAVEFDHGHRKHVVHMERFGDVLHRRQRQLRQRNEAVHAHRQFDEHAFF